MLRNLLASAIVTCAATYSGLASAEAGWSPEMRNAAQAWDSFLGKYVNAKGGVDYQAIVGGSGFDELKQLLGSYATMDPTALSDSAKNALYINFYNAGMIHNIIVWANAEKVDIKSDKFLKQAVNKIKAPGGNIWNGQWKFKIKGINVHLDEIEHGLIRGLATGELGKLKVKELDPRIHAAVNCAAYSCPRTREKAYRPENVDAMLNENMFEWLNMPAQFAKLSDSKMKCNQIVFWYYSDFDDVARQKLKLKGAGDYLEKFIKAETPNAEWMKSHLKNNFNDRNVVSLKISSAFEFFYDWRIADARSMK